MSKTKTTSGLPGSIFKRGNKWYITIGGEQRSTGIDATPEGLKLVQRIHKEAYMESLKNSGKLPKQNTTQTFTFLTAWEEFIEYKKAKQLVKKSIYTYQYSFDLLLSEYKNYQISEQSLNRAAIELLKIKKYKPASKNIYLRHIQYFLNWCYENKIISEKINIFSKFKLDAPKKIFMDYSEEEIKLILSAAQKKDREFYSLIMFMLLTGSRIKETLSLKWTDIDFDNWLILFPNKTKKTIIDRFPISEKLMPLLKELKILSEKRLGTEKKAKVFRWESSSDSSLGKKLRLLEAGIEKIIKETTNTEIKIKKVGRAFHGFRKTFSDNLIDNEIDIYSLKDLMRHKDISTTLEIYKDYKTKKLRDILNKTGQEIPVEE